MNENKFLVRNSKLSTKEVANELILLGEDETKVFTLNETGRRVWDLADGKIQIKEIAGILASEYNVSFRKAKEDTLLFLREANRHSGIFELLEAPIKN